MLAKRPEVHIYVPGIAASDEKVTERDMLGERGENEGGMNGSGYTPGTTPSPPLDGCNPSKKQEKGKEGEREVGATARMRCEWRVNRRLFRGAVKGTREKDDEVGREKAHAGANKPLFSCPESGVGCPRLSKAFTHAFLTRFKAGPQVQTLALARVSPLGTFPKHSHWMIPFPPTPGGLPYRVPQPALRLPGRSLRPPR